MEQQKGSQNGIRSSAIDDGSKLGKEHEIFLSEEKKRELLMQLETAPAFIRADIIPRLDKPMQLETVRYYYYIPRWKKDQVFIGLFYGDWPNRNLASKGIKSTDRCIAERITTVDEVIDYCWRWRLHSLNYNSWQKLIEDEIRSGIDAAFIDKLKSFQDKYPLSDKWRANS